MPLVWNTTLEEQSFKVHGSWFVLKPDKMKLMDEDKCRFITENRKDQGLVVLPAEFEDPEFKTTPEGAVMYEKFKQQGIDNYIAYHRDLIRNNQVSLRRDLSRADIKVDPAIEASEGELNAMRIVAKYQKTKDDSAQKRVEEVNKLMGTIGTIEK